MNVLKSENLSYKYWKVALLLLVLVYMCNLFTPLRLTNDTIRYFRLAEEKLGTWPKPHFQDFLPSGYVTTLFILAKAGILSSFTIAALNGLFMAGSFCFLKKLFSVKKHFTWMAVLFLLNWNAIKFTLTPLSEMQFLFFSSGCLYYYIAFGETRKWWHLILSIVFCALAVYTRTAGIALALALIITPVLKNYKTILDWIRQHRWKTLCIVLAIAALIVFQFNQYGVRTYLSYYSSDGNPGFLLKLWTHTQEIGELMINIPLSKAVTVLPPFVAISLYTITGVFFVFILVKAVFSKKLEIPFVIRVYLTVYSLLVISWPFFDVRFWFPVFPLILWVLLTQVNSDWVNRKWIHLRNVYLSAYFLTGIFSISYYTWLSFNRNAMAQRHDAGQWKMQYRAHFFGEPFRSEMFEDDAIYFLDKYDAAHKRH